MDSWFSSRQKTETVCRVNSWTDHLLVTSTKLHGSASTLFAGSKQESWNLCLVFLLTCNTQAASNPPSWVFVHAVLLIMWRLMAVSMGPLVFLLQGCGDSAQVHLWAQRTWPRGEDWHVVHGGQVPGIPCWQNSLRGFHIANDFGAGDRRGAAWRVEREALQWLT